ncbi:hypothetical protein RhiirA4_490377 [Rhizophagus irregularis]|uniref:Uncharacterized protein n=1 Tax=Rhizophagus irregularis TaxID=588596 RepID=A0A2I1HVQ4_9GLOM|nr:hypothetical protein RhiirA4_490377 [Rhizophagus irregularis]
METNTIIVDNNDNLDSNGNAKYDKTLKDYQVSRKPKFAELHHKIADVVDKRKCIHILVELLHRNLSKRLERPDIF